MTTRYTGPDPANPHNTSPPRPARRTNPSPRHRTPPPPPPRSSAACAEHPDLPPDAWFGDPKYGETARARDICLHDCPVREQCIDYALSIRPDPLGIWAGLTPDQRTRLRHARERSNNRRRTTA